MLPVSFDNFNMYCKPFRDWKKSFDELASVMIAHGHSQAIDFHGKLRNTIEGKNKTKYNFEVQVPSYMKHENVKLICYS